ncbi:MAG: DUF3667 domain-containing protein [Draconibacterium sp.]
MKNLLNRFKRLLKPVEQPVAENTTCENCGTVFTGRFCPECGQSVSDFDKPFGFIIINFLGDFFAFDTRFFRTLKALILKPGFLPSQFFDGKRVPYAPPIRIFIFSSFLMFLLLQWQTSRIFNESLQNDTGSANYSAENDETLLNSNKTATQYETIINDSVVIVDFDPLIFSSPTKLKQQLDHTIEVLEKNLESADNESEKKEIRQLIRTLSDPEMMVNKMLKLMSWAFFLLLPVFALMLKLFYRRVHFVRHLIFSIYMHSFIFVVLIVIVLLGFILYNLASWPILIVLLTIPVYLIIAMKNFFGQRILAVLPRFVGVTVLYNLVFIFVLLFVVLNAMRVI